ncbi:MAG: hypothetical protein JWM86_1107 [Thermoleophilia bacterium]|nr:hypothetical protein [Thermoleophilia bacterium]
MAFDVEMAERMRDLLAEDPRMSERKMFGSIALFVDGNMACGVREDDILIRVGPDDYETALLSPEAEPFAPGGRTMRGFVQIDTATFADDDGLLAAWLMRGVAFAGSLPPK